MKPTTALAAETAAETADDARPQPVRTAGEVADHRTPAADAPALPDQLGELDAHDPVIVSRTQLGAILRAAHPTHPEMRVEHDWWVYRLPAAGLAVEGEGLDELARHATQQLRDRVAALDPSGASGDPLVWLVLSSTDEQLREWLHIPS